MGLVGNYQRPRRQHHRSAPLGLGGVAVSGHFDCRARGFQFRQRGCRYTRATLAVAAVPGSPRPRLPGLRRARELAALTQAELADKAGIHRVSLANLERGAVGALPRTVRALAEALDCSPVDLLSQPKA